MLKKSLISLSLITLPLVSSANPFYDTFKHSEGLVIVDKTAPEVFNMGYNMAVYYACTGQIDNIKSKVIVVNPKHNQGFTLENAKQVCKSLTEDELLGLNGGDPIDKVTEYTKPNLPKPYGKNNPIK